MDLLEPTIERVAWLEAAAADALAPAEDTRLDGWRFRSNHGVTRRGNSVLPEQDGGWTLARRIGEVEAFYRRRGLEPRMQLSAAARPIGLDDQLERRGWRREEGARVLYLSLAGGRTSELHPGGGADRGEVRIAGRPDAGFLGVQAAVQPGSEVWAPQRAQALRELGLVPWHLEVRGEDGRAVAAGLAVLDPDRRVVGLFSLATLPAERGRGHGRRLIEAAAARGRAAGARGAYLQVDARNDAALRLYRRLGFSVHHAYHYRLAPER